MYVVLLLVISCLAFGDSFEKLSELFQKTETVKVIFKQRVKYEWYPKEDVSKGVFYGDKKGRFKLEYHSPEKLTIISDGKRVYIINYEEKIVYVEPLKKDFSPVLGALFMLSRPIEEVFNLIMEKREGDKIILLLKPKERDSNIEEVYITLNPSGEVQAIRFYDSHGTETTIEFIEVKRNFKPSARLFKVEIPEGFRAVGDEEGGNPP